MFSLKKGRRQSFYSHTQRLGFNVTPQNLVGQTLLQVEKQMVIM
jgi:hypothetical protein